MKYYLIDFVSISIRNTVLNCAGLFEFGLTIITVYISWIYKWAIRIQLYHGSNKIKKIIK